MKFELHIARRYLMAKKSHQAINIISIISALGVAIATAALICILSVFNGFQDMVAGLLTNFDPQLKIEAAQGKFIDCMAPELQELKNDDEIDVVTFTIEDNALISTNNRQLMVTVKGVDDTFTQQVDFDKIRLGDGEFMLQADVLNYGIMGEGLMRNLGIDETWPDPINVYAPRRGQHIDLNDPIESFSAETLFSPDLAFCVRQARYDASYILTSLEFAQELFEQKNRATAVELRLKPNAVIDNVQARLRNSFGNKYTVRNRYEQQEDTFRIMQLEKMLSYVFLTFILVVACFNIIGSLSMLILEKRDDMKTLFNLGATDRQIFRIFMCEGSLISIAGAVLGLIIGISLCLLQQEFGLIRFGNAEGMYIIDTYPVSVHLWDIVLTFFTVAIVGLVSVWYPVRHFTRKMVQKV